jgi:hypothetical protein
MLGFLRTYDTFQYKEMFGTQERYTSECEAGVQAGRNTSGMDEGTQCRLH